MFSTEGYISGDLEAQQDRGYTEMQRTDKHTQLQDPFLQILLSSFYQVLIFGLILPLYLILPRNMQGQH